MNSLSREICVIVGVVAMLWSGAWFFKEESRRDQGVSSAQQPSADKTSSTFHQELAALRNRLAQVENAQPNLARLQGRLAHLEDGQQDLRAELNAAPPQDLSLASGEAIDGSALEPEISGGEREQKLFALFETQFFLESDDPAWSHQTEASLTQAVTNAAFDGSHLLLADCRTTICQVEVGHESEVAQDGFIDHFPFVLPFDTEVFYQRIEGEGGMPYTVMYMARAGQRLPTLAQ